MSNLAKLRRAVRACALTDEDAAGVELAAQLAGMLDLARPRTLTQIANGERDLSLEDRLDLVKVVAPIYLRTLNATGLTKAGRAVQPSANVPTQGSGQGVSADTAAHDRHRQRFSERRSG